MHFHNKTNVEMGISASLVRRDSQSEISTQPDDDFTDIHRQEEFILSTVYPDLKSYTWENPRSGEIIELRSLSIDVNSYPHMLAFDRAFFEVLGRFDNPVAFYSRGYSFQKAFIKRLLDVILHPVSDDSEIYYSFVELFISRYAVDGVAVNECKSCVMSIHPSFQLSLSKLFVFMQMDRLEKP